MNILFGDIDERKKLLPITFTRPASQIRCGILTIEEKWTTLLKGAVGHITVPYLCESFPATIGTDNLLINGTVLPSADLINTVQHLSLGEVLMRGNCWIAARMDNQGVEDYQSYWKT